MPASQLCCLAPECPPCPFRRGVPQEPSSLTLAPPVLCVSVPLLPSSSHPATPEPHPRPAGCRPWGELSWPESNRNQQGTGSRQRLCPHRLELGPDKAQEASLLVSWGWRWGGRRPPSSSQLKLTNPGSRAGPLGSVFLTSLLSLPGTLIWSRPRPAGADTSRLTLSATGQAPVLCQAHLHSLGWVGVVSLTSHTTPVARRWELSLWPAEGHLGISGSRHGQASASCLLGRPGTSLVWLAEGEGR